ncbi:MAG: YraN family protein [Sedimentisphaeraceae bacterium JB056]
MFLFLTRGILLRNRRLLGRWGERYAQKYLKGKGYIPLAFNFKSRSGEIDLVTRSKDGTFVFVEVKTRGFKEFLPAVNAVNKKKQRNITNAARQFIRKHGIFDQPQRYDIITIVLPRKGKPKLTHYPNAFYPA